MNTSAHEREPVLELRTASPAETLAVGQRLAGLLRPGDVVLLVGRLGAGKTLFASGIGEGMGVQEPVVSPSFVLVRSYDGFVPLIHADVYRLGSTAEFDDLDLFSSANDGIVLVEWGNAVAAAIPDDHLVVEIVVRDEHSRAIRFTPQGTWRNRSLSELVS